MKHLFRPNVIKPGETIAELSGVVKNGGDLQILKGVDFTVRHGDFIAVTGPSGSGKSTALRTIAGLERPDSGKVTLLGNDLYGMRESKKAQLIASRVGVGFQSHNLDTGMTLVENMESLAESRGKEIDYDRFGRLIVALGLQGKMMAHESVANLSGGEKQRLALGRLLLPAPEIVLLDEPTASIDPEGKSRVYAALQEMNQTEGTTVVVVTHDEVALQYANRHVIINSGQVVYDGASDSYAQPIIPPAA